jgi:hypothetical protein
MNSLSRAKPDPHTKRLLVDEAEWRDRLNQLADMRRTPVAAGAAIVAARATSTAKRRRAASPCA